MPPRKRKVVYPTSRSARPAGAGPAAAPIVPRTVVAIDRAALTARTDLAVGSRVVILGTGLYAGETAVIERLTSGVIPSATVRTESGRTRPVRTVDLALVPAEAQPPA